MAQNDNSGMGVVLGILLAVVVIVGAYFFFQSNGTPNALEPAAGIEAPNVNIDMPDNVNITPDAEPAQ